MRRRPAPTERGAKPRDPYQSHRDTDRAYAHGAMLPKGQAERSCGATTSGRSGRRTALARTAPRTAMRSAPPAPPRAGREPFTIAPLARGDPVSRVAGCSVALLVIRWGRSSKQARGFGRL